MSTPVTRWNPFVELERMWPRDLFGRLHAGDDLLAEWRPSCDVTEDETTMTVHAELPGISPEDVDISVEDDSLVVRGEKRSEGEREEHGRKYSERFFGSFERVIPLPGQVDVSKVDATLKDGVLEIRIPKPTADKHQSKKIEIKSA